MATSIDCHYKGTGSLFIYHIYTPVKAGVRGGPTVVGRNMTGNGGRNIKGSKTRYGFEGQNKKSLLDAGVSGEMRREDEGCLSGDHTSKKSKGF